MILSLLMIVPMYQCSVCQHFSVVFVFFFVSMRCYTGQALVCWCHCVVTEAKPWCRAGVNALWHRPLLSLCCDTGQALVSCWCQRVVTQAKPWGSCWFQCVVRQAKSCVLACVSVMWHGPNTDVLLTQATPWCSCWCQCIMTQAKPWRSCDTGQALVDCKVLPLLFSLQVQYSVVTTFWSSILLS